MELRSQVSGFITGIFFKEGDVVEKGKELYEVDRRKYVAAYDQAVANLASADANLVKAKKILTVIHIFKRRTPLPVKRLTRQWQPMKPIKARWRCKGGY